MKTNRVSLRVEQLEDRITPSVTFSNGVLTVAARFDEEIKPGAAPGSINAEGVDYSGVVDLTVKFPSNHVTYNIHDITIPGRLLATSHAAVAESLFLTNVDVQSFNGATLNLVGDADVHISGCHFVELFVRGVDAQSVNLTMDATTVDFYFGLLGSGGNDTVSLASTDHLASGSKLDAGAGSGDVLNLNGAVFDTNPGATPQFLNWETINP